MEDLAAMLRMEDLKGRLASYSWNVEDPELITAVNDAFLKGTLTLFLGAGVSANLKFPLWSQLVSDLYEETFNFLTSDETSEILSELQKATNTVAIRQLEVALKFPSDLRKMLRKRLYEKYDDAGLNDFIRPLCEYFMLGQICTQEIITYNFDNALERFLQRQGNISFSVCYSEKQYPYTGGIRVYHPHGFLPHPDDDMRDEILLEEVAFSERRYNQQLGDPSHWANLLQFQHLTNRNCLFLGMSMTDSDQRRFLDCAKQRVGGVPRHISVQKVRNTALANYFLEQDLLSLGVRTLWVRDYVDIPNLFPRLAKQR